MLKKQRAFALLLMMALLISACVAPASQRPAVEGVTPVATAATVTEATTVEEARTLTHVMGEITLPATPQRIVVLEWSYVEDLLAVGVQPIGVADIEGYNAWVKIPVALAPDVVDVGTRQAPNLETIATLAPDLIIAAASRVKESYDELSAIAPTLVFDNYPTDKTHYESMVETFTLLADIVERQSEGDAVLAAMEAKFATARAQLEAAGRSGETFGLAQAFSNDNQAQIRMFTDNALAVQVIAQLGLTNGWTEEPQPYGFSTVSVEALPALGDLNFFYVVQDDDNVFATEAITPLWENLEFVKAGHAYPVGGDTWLFGGPLSVELLVDIVMNQLAPDAVAVPAATAAEGATRLFTHALGETEIPVNPQRIVVLDGVDNLLALGVKPVGAAQWIGSASGMEAAWPAYLDPADLEGITFLGASSEPNLEALVALHPDLIIGRTNPHEEIYAQLSQIAPTVIVDIANSGQWREQFILYAEILGREAEAQALMAQFEERATAIAERLAQLDPNPEVSVARFDPERIVMYQGGLFVGQVLAAAGVQRPANQAVDNSSEQLSLETITELDADVIFAIESNPEQSRYQELVDTPLWGQLRAVQNERVYAVPFDLWIGGWTIIGANRILDDVERYLLPE